MSNTGGNRNFRRVDVDKYDENAYVEEAETSSEAFNEMEVTNLINTRNYSEAIKAICQSPIIKSDNTQQKTSLVESFLRLNGCIKANNIPELVSALSDDDKENLIKVVYMSFIVRQDADHTLTHIWFEKAHQDVGHGAIVRAMTDRKSLLFKS